MICCRVFPSGTCRHLLLARKTCRRENTHRLAMKCTTKNSFKISADCHGNVFLNMMEQGRSVTNRGNCWHKNYRGTSVTRRSRDDHEKIRRKYTCICALGMSRTQQKQARRQSRSTRGLETTYDRIALCDYFVSLHPLTKVTAGAFLVHKRNT